ncbi:MAG: alkaline phosphatase family protein [Pseudobdellovibrio sp.]
MLNILLIALCSLLVSVQSFAASPRGKYFDRAITVIFENENYTAAIKQPFFNQLARRGANFTNFSAITHPSQPNYIALTSGSLNNVTNDKLVDINSKNIVDLLEAKKLTWKAYIEDYPGNCFTGNLSGKYVRKHNPFISYLNIQNNASRCANIVNASNFEQDAANGTLPNYVFYVPNNRNNGHDTNVTFADKWYSQKFTKYVNDTNFMQNTILISTFDEGQQNAKLNQIYTSIVGATVKSGDVSAQVNLYSLLNLLEDNWSLGNLGKADVTAAPIPNIW